MARYEPNASAATTETAPFPRWVYPSTNAIAVFFFVVLVFLRPSVGQTRFGSLTAGSGPRTAAVNVATNLIYVLNDDGNVTVIDGATGITSTIALAETCTGL